MQMCPFCDKVYDESEYSHCPYCSGELQEDTSPRPFKVCPNCDGVMEWDGCWKCLNCGEEVYSGDKIGSVGDSGAADGVHLHFELRNDEYGRVNPWDFLQ